jgi:hypothetical protein
MKPCNVSYLVSDAYVSLNDRENDSVGVIIEYKLCGIVGMSAIT